MGELQKRVDLNLLVYGNGLAENFKTNSLFFYEKYQKSDNLVKSINISDVYPGGFYFFHYLDDSNWLKWSPVFVADYKKFESQLVVFAINFNFIPLEIRVMLFDKFMDVENFEKDSFLKVSYEGVYSELIRLGFEYALIEFNAIQIKFIHKISMELVPRFLHAQHPKNTYDPNKLMEIWTAKLSTKAARNQEIMLSTINEFYDVRGEISDKYVQLKGHIERMRKSLKKYGGR